MIMLAGKKFIREANYYVSEKVKDFDDLPESAKRELASAFFEDQDLRTQQDILIEAHDYKLLSSVVAQSIKKPSRLNDFTTLFIDNIMNYLETSLHLEYSELVCIYETEIRYEIKQQQKLNYDPVSGLSEKYLEKRYIF